MPSSPAVRHHSHGGAQPAASVFPTALPATRPSEKFELADDFFERQRSRREDLPNPEPLLANLAAAAIEVIAGAREVEQMIRWVSEDVFQHLLRRSIIAERARAMKGVTPIRPRLRVQRTIVTEPADGIVEATVIVQLPTRCRAIALRLEGLDRRWIATAIHVL